MTDSSVNMERILAGSKVIAVVGLSGNPERPSHDVAAYMQRNGYRILPVNPKLDGPVLGEQPYQSLEEIGEHVDIVDVFRRPVDVPSAVDGAIAIGADTVWMQLGIVNNAAAAKAEAAGITVVMDRCIKVEHRRLIGQAGQNTSKAKADGG